MGFIGRLFVVISILFLMVYVFCTGINFFFTRYAETEKKKKGTMLFLSNIPLIFIAHDYLWAIILPLSIVFGIELFFISKALLKK